MKTLNSAWCLMLYLVSPEYTDYNETCGKDNMQPAQMSLAPSPLEVAKAVFWWFAAVILPVLLLG